MKGIENLRHQIERYQPFNEQEQKDKEMLLIHLAQGDGRVLTRGNRTAHFTASAWVTDLKREKILMAYHNLYDSWSWMGGHADGDADLLYVAKKEVMEESGIEELNLLYPDIFSLEILTVDGHRKKGEYISSHLHLNLTYLFEADPSMAVRCKEDENSAVAWFGLDEAVEKSTEPWFRERIYTKLNAKLRGIKL